MAEKRVVLAGPERFETVLHVEAKQLVPDAEGATAHDDRRVRVRGEVLVFGHRFGDDLAAVLEAVQARAVVFGGDQELFADLNRRWHIEIAPPRLDGPEPFAALHIPTAEGID